MLRRILAGLVALLLAPQAVAGGRRARGTPPAIGVREYAARRAALAAALPSDGVLLAIGAPDAALIEDDYLMASDGSLTRLTPGPREARAIEALLRAPRR